MYLAICRKKERVEKNSAIPTASNPATTHMPDPQTTPEKFNHHCNKISSINPKQKTSNKPLKKKIAIIKIQR